ncbi:hypothetical protein ABW20_dc0100377 [Dactylellina cionopaga]|nr:hypothetical protein ABW20_dc0100377 [Dactylellina cionopaga]
MTIHLLNLLSPAQPIFYDTILKLLDPPDTLNLLATCRTLRVLKPDLWNINRSLRRFVDDPLAFRSLMARHNTVVSGSHALQFLARVRWTESDLDVYLGDEEGCVEFAEHLIEHENYSFVPYQWQSEHLITAIANRREERERYRNEILAQLEQETFKIDPDTGAALTPDLTAYRLKAIEGVFSFVHKTIKTRKIQLMPAKDSPLVAILGDYYATHIFNFVTWNKAYSLFPYHTFGDKRAFFTQPATPNLAPAIVKYKKRGFELCHYGKFHKCVKNCCLRPHRRIGDKFSWVMDLDTEGVDALEVKVPPSVMETNSWGMHMHRSWLDVEEKRRRFRTESHIYIAFQQLSAQFFKHFRIFDVQATSLRDFLYDRTTSYGETGDYIISFPEAKRQDRGDSMNIWMDDQFENWYRFWETSIMPYENMWMRQYPMLGGQPTVTINGVQVESEVPVDED